MKKEGYTCIYLNYQYKCEYIYLGYLHVCMYTHAYKCICMYVCTYVLEDAENEGVIKNKIKEPWKIAKALNRSERWGLTILD